MWPINRLRDHAYQRKRAAALAVLLGIHLYERLEQSEKMKVEAKVGQMLKWTGVPYVLHKRIAPLHAKAAYRAVAMSKLEIPTGIRALTWEAVLPRMWALNPAFIYFTFSLFDRATSDAALYLRAQGYSEAEDFSVSS